MYVDTYVHMEHTYICTYICMIYSILHDHVYLITRFIKVFFVIWCFWQVVTGTASPYFLVSLLFTISLGMISYFLFVYTHWWIDSKILLLFNNTLLITWRSTQKNGVFYNMVDLFLHTMIWQNSFVAHL